MRRFLVTLVAAGTIATSAFAVAPQFWRAGSAEDFLAGEIEGFAVTTRGELRAAPAMKKLASFTDPFVLSQASAPNGDRFFGTGNDGKIYRLRGTDLKVLYTSPEPEIYTVSFHNGALYAGTSPNGKIYRIDPESGTSAVFYDPQQAYIWAMQWVGNGDLAVATGVEGKLFRVTPKGEGKVWYDSPDTHLRSIGVRKDGSLLVGAASKGRIYAVADDGSAHALYDSPLNEITSIYVDPSGIGWAAGVSNQLPSSAPAKSTTSTAKSSTQSSSSTSSSSEPKKDDSATASASSSGNVEVSFSFDDSSSGSAAQPGASELYKINTDDFVESAEKFEREIVYGVSGGSNGSVLLSTGPNGRIYELQNRELALIGSVPEKQIVSISNEGGATLITTTNSGAVYRMESGAGEKGEFRSAAKDVERFSRFGHYRIEGHNIGNGNLAIAFRSGNTRTPDATWSPWTKEQTSSEGSVDSPAGRYIQWRLTMPKAASDLAVDGVTVAFVNRNVAPEIDSVVVQDPAVIFISSAYPSSPQVVEATNPDEYGIFTSLDSAREKSTSDQGKRAYRKGYRTVSWRAHDANNDSLRYSLYFRRKGADTWLRLRENLDETQMNFDTSQLPDGRYELRLIASDIPDNAEGALTDMKEGVEFQVDNTAPSISVSNSGNVTIRVTDSDSAVGKVEYSADAQKWVRLTPADGIADSRDETFTIEKKDLTGKYVIVRAVDAFYNVATQAVNVP
ncbi:MAG TPA: WD40 repeat domain-containing protein [Thermoanaerobaculia bacterium]|nr:WD40 repeat domain-containing protein [Thermoanaerobaculia bacterium]